MCDPAFHFPDWPHVASYGWIAPAGSSGACYFISWDGQRVADDARAGMLV